MLKHYRDRTPTTRLSDITWDSQTWRLNIPQQSLRLLRTHLQSTSQQTIFLIAKIRSETDNSVLLAIDRVDESDMASGPVVLHVDETAILVVLLEHS